MAVRLSSKADASLPGLLAEPAPRSGVELVWLGQAGFLIRGAHATVVIDPYLSDSLAAKYRGRELAHERMMAVPVPPSALAPVDLVLVTHAHTDHLDPGTLPGLAAANPNARFVIPRAHLAPARERGVPPVRTVPVNAGESWSLAGGPPPAATIHAVPAAHEERERDEAGNDRYLGYVVELAGLTVYHSGDCVPFPGMVELLRGYRVDLALLPINGRDEFRASRGVPGNFTVEEAWGLASEIGASALVGHHFGMFEFNTVDPGEACDRFELCRASAAGDGPAGPSHGPDVTLPGPGVRYRFEPGDRA